MIRQLANARRKRILIDISTQKDLFLATGKACIRNHRRVLRNVRRMIAWARRRGIPVISTCEVYPENGNGNGEHHYCIDGTEGQEKISYTLLSNRTSFPADGDMNLPIDILRRYNQVILHKRTQDPFDEPRIERLLTEIKAGEFILIGAEAESAVKATALGLLQRNKKVSVVTDAVGAHDRGEADLAFRKMKAKGAKLTETKDVAGRSHLRSVGICHCKTCTQGNGNNND
ncbi:MAG: cysteine hydrolase family protein [Planctomycetota bacterium]|jgi:nicotinamidase-related amidase